MNAQAAGKPAPRTLRLLSFNIQAGADCASYSEYVTRSWQSVLPHAGKGRNLKQVAGLVANYDLVALQEADAGSLRSGFQNQVHYLAETAGFPYWSHQPNRRVARIAEPSNGLLSRMAPSEVLDHRLPGAIPGRGALEVRFGTQKSGLHVIIAHLALSARARRMQIDYLAEIIGEHPHAVLMGDFNCTADSAELRALLDKGHMRSPEVVVHTFPSWSPNRAIDHILVSQALTPISLEVPVLKVSDHLPVAMTVGLPESCIL